VLRRAERVTRAAIAISCRRTVAVVALAWKIDARAPAARVRLKAIAVSASQGLLHGGVTSEVACPGRVGWEDVAVPKPYPREFRDDVVRVARNREPGVTSEQVADDFGVHPMTLSKWLRVAAVEDGVKPGVTSEQAAEIRELRRRNRLLEQENEVLRRAAAYLSQAQLPGKGSTRS
jgi:transposase